MRTKQKNYLTGKELNLMRGQGSLAVILLALLALGGGIFFFTSMSPSSSQEGQRQQPVVNPVDYVEKAVVTPPSQAAQETTQKVLQAAGVQPSDAGAVATQANYEIRYIGPTEHVSWAEYSVAITANTAEGVTAAKAAAEQWLLIQGYKPEDLCAGIPITFFLSEEAGKAVYEAGQTFSRVPSFCQ